MIYHYDDSGLPPDDRTAVEESYLSGRIHVLCSTSTLAHGVNLPAHLVIIKVWCVSGGGRGEGCVCVCVCVCVCCDDISYHSM